MTVREFTPQSAYEQEEIDAFYAAGHWRNETLGDILDRRAAQDPGHALVIDRQRVYSNAEVRETAYRIARGLREIGVQPGDRVAIQLPSWPEYIFAYFAAARLGAIMVPMMPVYRHKEVGYILDITGAVAYIGTSQSHGFDHLAMVADLRAELPELRHVISVREGSGVGDARLEDLFGSAGTPGDEELGPGPHPDDGHLIGFTSGTESLPKGCYHTWNSYSFTPRTQALIYDFGPEDIELVVSPPTHTAGLAAGVLKPFVGGGAMSLMAQWATEDALSLITDQGASVATGATPFISMLADAFDPARHNVSKFRIFLCGGAPVPAALIERVRATLRTTSVLPIFGQTESLMLTTCLPGESDERCANSSGRAIPGATVAILDSDGIELPSGEVGEICYRTPGAMMGYWRNPLATAAGRFPGGWRRTGDLGVLDADGYLQITGRIKEMIIRGGLNISAREVEEMLTQHPDIAAAAVIGVPDDRLGERVGAFIVARSRAPELRELTDFLEARFRLAKQKLPEVLIVVPEFPMTATGKVSKRHLREQLDAR